MTSANYPASEQWRQLQGGEPLILANEESTVFQIAHIYNHDDAASVEYFDADLARRIDHYGCIIDTPAIQMNRSIREPVQLLLGVALEPITVPPTMLIANHGKPCALRSKGWGRENGYTHIGTQRGWMVYLETCAKGDWDIWRINAESPKLQLELTGPVSSFLV